MGVNGTECIKWKEKVLNREGKLFLVYNVSTIFVTYCVLSRPHILIFEMTGESFRNTNNYLNGNIIINIKMCKYSSFE